MIIFSFFFASLIKPVWLTIYFIIAFFIVDLFFFNETFIIEKEDTEAIYLTLQEHIQAQKEYYKNYLEEERLYNEMLENNKEYKASAREYECGKNEYFCKKDTEGNFLKYKDAVGVETICYGNTSFPEERPNIERLSKRECEYLLEKDINAKLSEFYKDELYLKHKEVFDSHPRDKEKYLDVAFFAGFSALKYKKCVKKGCKKQLTETYKAALENPLSEKAEALLKTYNKVGGKENAGLKLRHEKNIKIARNERNKIFDKKDYNKELTLDEYFAVYSGI